MSYKVTTDSGYAIVHLTGDIDLSCSPEARKLILEHLAAGKHTLVDLSGVTYIDSSGIASLVEGYQTARKKNLQFGLLAVSEPAMSVLELARLDKVFPIHASVADRVK
ncbi:MAG TPA: STAS domain-containing protein [Gammaproteobacteria bacterium]|nr:STAS domain-containing protein [Gammaproteobacteria bacterium]